MRTPAAPAIAMLAAVTSLDFDPARLLPAPEAGARRARLTSRTQRGQQPADRRRGRRRTGWR
ncbi:MAG: hypothetical protein ACRDKY_05050, partial [Solirubrobacteraceae bacterium]